MVYIFRSEPEKNRWRDLLYELRNRREQMQYSIKHALGSRTGVTMHGALHDYAVEHACA